MQSAAISSRALLKNAAFKQIFPQSPSGKFLASSSNVNVNENKFNYIDFQTITNIRYTIDLNTVESNKNNTKIFVAAIQIEFERGDEV